MMKPVIAVIQMSDKQSMKEYKWYTYMTNIGKSCYDCKG